MSSVRLVHITDLHLFGSETETLRGVATYPALRATLERAQARDWPPDALLVTGDLVQDDPAGYALVRRVLAPLDMPVLCLPGNHDVPEAMRRELRGPPFVLTPYFDLGLWRIVLLDSCIPGSAAGRLGEPALQTLREALASAGNRHVLVCLHHHPVPLSSRWLDSEGLENAGALFDIVDRHRNVRAIAWGHVHQSFESLRKNVRLLATPSTCAQFLPRADDFAMDSRPPAYRTFELHADGTIATELVWLDASSGAGSAAVHSAA